MLPSSSEDIDRMGAASSIGSSDSQRAIQRYARLAFAVVLAWLAVGAFRGESGYIPLLSDIDLAIHEFGHMLFMPFGIPILGRTMVILGGSLTQVAFPLLFVGYFLRKREDGRRRDAFAAMVCLWWSAINLLDVSIYCADSRAGELTLPRRTDGQGKRRARLVQPSQRLGTARAGHHDCALDARDRVRRVPRQHHRRSLDRGTTTARAARES